MRLSTSQCRRCKCSLSLCVFFGSSKKRLRREKATPQVLEERRLCVELNTGNGHTAHHPMSVRGRNWPPEDQEPPETPYPIERLSEAQRLLVDGGGGK